MVVEIKIEGEAYEFTKKYVFTPFKPIMGLESFATPVGKQEVLVRYVVHIPPIPARILNILSKGDIAHYVSIFVFNDISCKGEIWKYPSEGAFETEDLNTALFLADMVKRVVGGSWIIESNGKYYVWTRGYYHYVGA